MFYRILAILLMALPNICIAQSNANEIIEKSIAFHDPDGILTESRLTLDIMESRPNGSDRKSKAVIDVNKEYYLVEREVDGATTSMKVRKGKSSFKLNGKKKFSKEDKEKYKLTPERAKMMSQYYRYLWLSPLILKDPGTIIDPSFNVVNFFGKTCMEIKVTYEPSVGGDIWYFYFNPETYALEGYRFYHDEAANDGEYILFEGMAKSGSVSIPQKRTWYMHKDDKVLGTDNLVKLSIK